MAKWCDVIGFQSEQTEIAPGVFEDQIIERKYMGDILQENRTLSDDSSQMEPHVLQDVGTRNRISVVADAWAIDNFVAMRYIHWAGVNWIVREVAVQHPRLVLYLGGVYHGPTA